MQHTFPYLTTPVNGCTLDLKGITHVDFMLTDKNGAPLTSKRIREIRGARHPSAIESGQSCAARRDKYDNFTGSMGQGVCQYCGLPRALHV